MKQDIERVLTSRQQIAGPRQFEADYVGFDIPDEFVVGYGLDYDNRYRNLPEIVSLKKAVFRGKEN